MKKPYSYLLSFLLGGLMTMLSWSVKPVESAPTAALGIDPQCLQCTVLVAKVKLSHYNPGNFNATYPQLNCWNYSETHKYCLSPVWIGVPWESVWGFGAACPAEWAVGTWVAVPGVGQFICLDHGGDITCKDGICNVDIMGPGGYAWDGKTFDANLLVPQSFLYRWSDKD